MLEQANSDVLILLDCCAAASSVAGSGSGITEVIAACGFEASAPDIGEHSFTRSLIEEMCFMALNAPFSVALLHNKVLSRIKCWNPRYNAPNDLQEKRKTPVYILLTNEANQRSIELTPLLKKPIDEFSSPFSKNLAEQADTTSSQTVEGLWPDPDFKSPKVLISVALEDDQTLRTDEWVEWIGSIPALATYTKIEGIYKSDSILVILSIPVALWDLLPRSPAVSFIGFTRSQNFVHTKTTSTPTAEAVENKLDKRHPEKKWFYGK